MTYDCGVAGSNVLTSYSHCRGKGGRGEVKGAGGGHGGAAATCREERRRGVGEARRKGRQNRRRGSDRQEMSTAEFQARLAKLNEVIASLFVGLQLLLTVLGSRAECLSIGSGPTVWSIWRVSLTPPSTRAG